jgi:hypothetical protein
MSTPKFVQYCLETFDENFEQNFKEFPTEQHKEFVICFIEHIRHYTLSDFGFFKLHKRDKIIFGNLSKESFELFTLFLCVHFKLGNIWTTYFATQFPNIEQTKPFIEKLKK